MRNGRVTTSLKIENVPFWSSNGRYATLDWLTTGLSEKYGFEVNAAKTKSDPRMLDTTLLGSIARQWMSADEVEVEGKRLRVGRTSRQGLRTVSFAMKGREYPAIERNPEKPSRWGQLVRSGHEIVQFKDVQANRFVAVAVDGAAKEYGGARRASQSCADHDLDRGIGISEVASHFRKLEDFRGSACCAQPWDRSDNTPRLRFGTGRRRETSGASGCL